MKIAVCWVWGRASEIFPNWRDGYKSAWEEIAKKHEVTWFLDGNYPDPNEKWDFVYLWDDSNSLFFDEFDKYSCRKGLSLTTDPQNFQNLHKCDVVFVESDPVYERVRRDGIRTVRAFGTDTDYFNPDVNTKKDIEYFYPATFSPWKRQSELAYLGDKLWLVGTMQPDGQYELDTCEKAGCHIEKGYFPVDMIRGYYRRAKKILIPAVHGSERTVLEAMSMNIPVEILHPDINKRAQSYITEQKESGLTPREFVLKNYSHITMANALLRGIEC